MKALCLALYHRGVRRGRAFLQLQIHGRDNALLEGFAGRKLCMDDLGRVFFFLRSGCVRRVLFRRRYR